jgi:hypothetical protein
VVQRTELTHAQIAGIGQVTRRALQETLYTNLVRKQAEHLAPDGAEQYPSHRLAWCAGDGAADRRDGRRVVSGMLVICLLVSVMVVALVLVIAFDRGQSAKRERLETYRRIQAAERDIADIGRQTRAAILAEVQRRLRQGPS